jgi:hypothetical protein
MSDNVEKLRSVLDLEDRIADIKGLGLMIFTGDPLRLFILPKLLTSIISRS